MKFLAKLKTIHIIQSVLLIGIGIYIFASPLKTLLAMVVVIAVLWLISGIIEGASALFNKDYPDRWPSFWFSGGTKKEITLFI